VSRWNGSRAAGVWAAGLVVAAVGLFAGARWGDSQELQRKRDVAAEGDDSARDVAVTVYNDNLGLVKDRRTVAVPRGGGEVQFTGVAALLDPTSVHLRALGNHSLDVSWQNYRNDVATTERLLQRYLNRPIEVRMKGSDVRRGTLLSFDASSLVVRASGGGVSVLSRGETQEIALAGGDNDFAAGPTLVWRVGSSSDRSVPVEVSYLTSGLTWHAEYVAVQDEAGTSMDLQGWATVENTSGETYESAKVKLVAGSVHRATVSRPPMPYETMMRADAMAGAAKLQERGFDEYHLYELPDRATIGNNEVKQLGLMRARGVKTTRKYVYEADKNADHVMTTLEFQNEGASGMGIPLPAGVVRVYQRDTDGSLEFTGEDRIEHTAKNETARVDVGAVFDVAVERKQTDFKQISRTETETTVEITLRNHRSKAIDVTVLEHGYGDWEIVQSSLPATKKDATSFEFSARCAPERPTTVSYTLRTRAPGAVPR
jgi:hypothetical protein